MSNSTTWNKLKRIFEIAAELEGNDRMQYLNEECGDNRALYDEIFSLLESHDQMGAIDKEIDSIRLSAISSANEERLIGQKIGNYKTVQKIGSGGMGAVFLAERADGQFEHKVAIKLMHNPFVSDREMDRFKAERQILARLQHEHIARLLDGGLTGDGHPFFVMEYVQGLPIDVYCNKHKMTIRERLMLFKEVIGAVEYAHRSLVIHRDIKPSNILVTNNGSVKLLDFGIARVLSDEPVSETVFSATDSLALPLTPAYASPEQINNDTISTQSDIYQLGLVLYELLTGFSPFNTKPTSAHELKKFISEAEPENPGFHFRTTGTIDEKDIIKTQKAAELRSASVNRIRKTLSGDLRSILLKALQKDPDKRYESAEKLHGDVNNYLNGDPITAHPDSKIYRLKKFTRRYPFEIAAVAFLAILLAGYIITITWHTKQTEQALEIAQFESEKSEEVVDFLLGMFEAGDPRLNPGETITANDLIDSGLQEATLLSDSPVVQANMFNVIGKVYTSLGEYEKAAEILTRAIDVLDETGEDHVADRVDFLNDLAIAKTRLSHYEGARLLYSESLAMAYNYFGKDHPKIAEIKTLKGSWVPVTGINHAAELRQQSLEIRISSFGENHLLTADSYMDVGKINRSMGEPELALEKFETAFNIRSRELGEEHPLVAESNIFMADVYRLYRKDTAKAEELYNHGLNILELAGAELAPTYLHGLTGLALLMIEIGNSEAAIELYHKNLALREEVFGNRHPAVAEALSHLAGGYQSMQQPHKAKKLYQESLSLWEDLVGYDHIVVSGVLISLGNTLVDMKKFDEARAAFDRALAIQHNYYGEESGTLVLRAIGRLYKHQGDFDTSGYYYSRALQQFDPEGTSLHHDAVKMREELKRVKELIAGKE